MNNPIINLVQSYTDDFVCQIWEGLEYCSARDLLPTRVPQIIENKMLFIAIDDWIDIVYMELSRRELI